MTKSIFTRIELYTAVFAAAVMIGFCPALSVAKNQPSGSHKIFFAAASDFVGDSTTDNTAALQAAIDSASKAGGGTVELSNGVFLTGPITLESNVTLRIDSTAKLLGTTYTKAYYPAGYDTTYPTSPKLNPLITSDNATDITITGGGTIDGNGLPWWTAYNTAKANGGTLPARPRLIQLNHSKNIVIDSVTLQNSPQFHVSLEYCWYVTIKYVTILAPSSSPNTDGIDPATCHVVHISHCYIDNGDDDIAVKSGNPDPSDPNAGCSQIWVSDCTFLHGHGVSIGSETGGGVDSLFVDSCTFNGTDNGIRIKSYRGNGGDVRGCVYSNITMQNVANPIWISGYYPKIPAETDPAQAVTAKTPYYHDISLVHVVITNSPTAGLIVGLPEEPLKNILLQDDTIETKTGLEIRNAAVDTVNTISKATYGPGYILQVNGVFSRLTSVNNVKAPVSFALDQNYPNPFNPSTVISYSIPKFGNVSLKVYDVIGREVATLVNGRETAGEHSVEFNGSGLASGVYFYRLVAGGYVQTRKLLLLK